MAKSKKTTSVKDKASELKKAQELEVEENVFSGMNSNTGLSKPLFALFAAVVLVGALWFTMAKTDIFDSGDDSTSSTQSIESQVRELIVVDSNEQVRNTLFINTPEALEELKSGASGVTLRDAKVGDYYIAFEGRGVVYRPEDKKIVSIVLIEQR